MTLIFATIVSLNYIAYRMLVVSDSDPFRVTTNTKIGDVAEIEAENFLQPLNLNLKTELNINRETAI